MSERYDKNDDRKHRARPRLKDPSPSPPPDNFRREKDAIVKQLTVQEEIFESPDTSSFRNEKDEIIRILTELEEAVPNHNRGDDRITAPLISYHHASKRKPPPNSVVSSLESDQSLKQASRSSRGKEKKPGAYAIQGRAAGRAPAHVTGRNNNNNNQQSSALTNISNEVVYPVTPMNSLSNINAETSPETSPVSTFREEEVMTADVAAVPVNIEGGGKTERYPKKWIIPITLIILAIAIAALALGIKTSQNADKNNDQIEETNPCKFKEVEENDNLPIAWKSCLCNNNMRIDIPDTHLLKYNSLKENFIQNSILSADFDNATQVCDSRNIALYWLAEDIMIEKEVPEDESSMIIRYALALLYLSTADNNIFQWKNNTGWLTSDSACHWAGILCNETDETVSIDLQDNNLVGTIPPEISLLAGEGVASLILFRNEISGPIPSEIGLLTKLTRLDAFENIMTGGIPTEIGLLSELRFLTLFSNLIAGDIPTEIGLLKNLSRLEMERNRLRGTIPSEIGNLESLSALIIGDNKLTGALPSSIANCTSLELFDAATNKITGAIPIEIGNFQNIAVLSLSQNKLTTVPSTIGLCTSLKILDLGYNMLGGTIHSQIGSLPNLEFLSLLSNNLKGTIPTDIGNCLNLTTLDLDRNRGLTGTMPSEIGRLSNLETLSSCSTGLSGTIPDEICDSKGPDAEIFWYDNRKKCKCCEVCMSL